MSTSTLRRHQLAPAIAALLGAGLLAFGMGAAPAAAAGPNSVTGVVTSQGAPVTGIQISASQGVSAPYTDITDADGEFALTGMDDGTYNISYFDALDRFKPKFIPSVTLDLSNPTETVSIELEPWVVGIGTISGVVVDFATDAPIDGATVSFNGGGEAKPGSVTVGSNGAFAFTDLPSGVNYSISANASGYLAHMGTTFSFDEAVPGAFTIKLKEPNAAISGTVRLSGTPVAGVSLSAQEAGGPGLLHSATTDGNGVYTFSGLGAGDYTVSMTGFVGPDHLYKTQSATVTAPANGTGTADFDVELRTARTISGTVTDESSQPIASICTWVLDGAGSIVASSPMHGGTNGRGFYSLEVEPGDYKVMFYDCDGARVSTAQAFALTYFDGSTAGGSASFANASTVTVAGSNVTVDIALEAGGTIGGTVSLQTPTGVTPLPSTRGMDATVYQFVNGSWEAVPEVHSLVGHGAVGDYQATGLMAGTYRVCFEDVVTGPRKFAVECWKDSATVGAATDIVVSAGGFVTDIDAAVGIPTPTFDPVAVTTDNLDSADEDKIDAPGETQQGAKLEVEVGSGLAGEWVALFGHSTPVLLGSWVQVPQNGIVSVPIPASMPVGQHTLVAQNADGGVVGWRGIRIASSGLAGTGVELQPIAFGAGGAAVLLGLVLLGVGVRRGRA